MEVSKSFGTHITENHKDNLSALFFGLALGQMGHKRRYLAKNASFGPNSAFFFGQKSIFWGDEEKLLVSSYQGANDTPFPVRLKLAEKSSCLFLLNFTSGTVKRGHYE